VAGAGNVESAVRGLCVALVARCAGLFKGGGSGASMSSLSAALVNALVAHEHMANFAAEICARARHTALPAALLREIADMPLTATSPGVKHIGGFIEALARASPTLMTQHFPSLKEQIDAPAHQIRSSVLQVPHGDTLPPTLF